MKKEEDKQKVHVSLHISNIHGVNIYVYFKSIYTYIYAKQIHIIIKVK